MPLDRALGEIPPGAAVKVTPVLPPRMPRPETIPQPAEWRVVGVRSTGTGVELLAAPRTLNLLETEA